MDVWNAVIKVLEEIFPDCLDLLYEGDYGLPIDITPRKAFEHVLKSINMVQSTKAQRKWGGNGGEYKGKNAGKP